MKLLERYASACGLKIGKQFLLENFYAVPCEKYITLNASSGMASKNYPYYTEIMTMLLPILTAQNIQVVQLGGKDDVPIPGCVHMHGKTSLHQSNYILRNAMLHFGNDSWCAHRAGALGIPLVTLFGPTSAANHSPYLADADKSVFIESHRWGKNPTFANQENPLSIALITPEVVCNAILKLLNLGPLFTRQSRLIGLLYAHAVSN